MKLHQWREAPASGPAKSPGCLGQLLVALVMMNVFVTPVWYIQVKVWTPLEKYYLGDYLNASMEARSPIRLLFLDYGKRRIMATNADITEDAKATIGCRLSEKARQAGARRLAQVVQKWKSEDVRSYLQQNVYHGRSLWQLFQFVILIPVFGTTTVLFWMGLRARRSRRMFDGGRSLQGPQIVTTAEFNRLKQSDGIGFAIAGKPSSRPLPVGSRRTMIRIPQREETQHILLMGDTGTGKSSLIRQLLLQMRDRGDAAVVYDPALEYTPQFFRRGTDQILNPLDERMPYWTPGDEVQHVAETLTLAKSLFPDKQNDSRFFVESARKVFAYLLRYKPTAQELSSWMKDPAEIDQRLQGTELAPLLDGRAPGQRSGVLASLNLVADAFELLPEESEVEGRWSASAWAVDRTGWLFLPAMHDVRERLLPVISMWLDSLILRLITQTDGNRRPVWIILDELASLQKLPQLATALAEGRKSNLRVLLGFQGRTQLETRYGAEAETMLSQPMTKIFLRTSEPRAAEWISKAIGEVEVERVRVSHTRQRGLLGLRKAQRDTYTTNVEHKTEPLVMASVIGGLPDLSGFVKSQNLAVSATFPYVAADRLAPAFVPRPMKTLELGADIAETELAQAESDETTDRMFGHRELVAEDRNQIG